MSEQIFILWDLSSFQMSKLTPLGFSLKSHINMYSTVYFFQSQGQYVSMSHGDGIFCVHGYLPVIFRCFTYRELSL